MCQCKQLISYFLELLSTFSYKPAMVEAIRCVSKGTPRKLKGECCYIWIDQTQKSI